MNQYAKLWHTGMKRMEEIKRLEKEVKRLEKENRELKEYLEYSPMERNR